MREAVFSSLGEGVQGARFLDLFAGTGSYGLEALSRGASRGEFVESDRRAIAVLKRNMAAVEKSLGDSAANRVCRVSAMDAVKWRSRDAEHFDLVFADPPYSWFIERGCDIFDIAERARHKCGCTLVFEMPGDRDISCPGWEMRRRLGKRGRGEPAVGIYDRV